jgi:hypothetical protein
MKTNQPKKKITLLLLFGALLLGVGYFLFKAIARPTQIAEVGTSTLPLTGSFFMNDTNATSAQIKTMVDEMAETGINTIIILAAGYLDKPNGAYQETNYLNDTNNRTRDVIKYANNHGMDIYIGLAAYDMNVVKHWIGTPTDASSDQGRLIDFSARLIANINAYANSQNIPLSRIKGYYLGEFGPANLATPTVNELVFWKHLSERVKAVAPDKKILISPYVLDENNYDYMKAVYENIYRETKVDIIAPQDSMGSLKVTSFAKSSELFRALKDATAAFPGKEAWANIETQLQPSVTDGNYNPSNIERVSGQIEAAKPYVSKMVTWIYQHTMLSSPEFDNLYSWTGQYTPARASARRTLRNAYLAKYTPPTTRFYYHTTNKSCQATTNQYNDTSLCQANLTQYLPNLTTGICYPTLAACEQEHPTPETPEVIVLPSETNAPLVYGGSPAPSAIPSPSVVSSPTPSPSSAASPTATEEPVVPETPTIITLPAESAIPLASTVADFLPGDLDKDRKVGLSDYNLLVSKFGNPYTLADYNNLVKNYGKTN